jgi:thioredoxin reductase (NADPH)
VFDYEVVIIGGGPAGLAAGLHLSRGGHRTLLVEKELFGGALQHTDRIDDYPGFPGGTSGAQLASAMIDQATASGLRLEQAEASGVEVFSRSRWVACTDGRGFSCGVVILAGGSRFRALGIPGEEQFRGRGVIDCTPCDAGFFVDQPVVVLGGSEYAIRDALHFAGLGAHVSLLAPGGDLTASPLWESRLAEAPNITIQRDVTPEDIVGAERVEGIVYRNRTTMLRQQLAASGIAVRVGLVPNTQWLDDVVDLDTQLRILVNADLETSAAHILACGDIRGGTRASVATAVGDGAAAAARASELLREGDRS